VEPSESADVASRPPPHTYEVVRGAVAGLLVGSAAWAVTALAIGSGAGSLAATMIVSLALIGIAIGGSVGLLVGVITGLVLRFMRGARGYLAASAAAALVGLAVVLVATTTDMLHEPEGVALWAVFLGCCGAAATPWIRRQS
jgi:hypothetical protein